MASGFAEFEHAMIHEWDHGLARRRAMPELGRSKPAQPPRVHHQQ
jgi:hypothetical protein